VTSSTQYQPVILWGDEFSSWIGVAKELHLRPVAVVLSSLNSVELVKASVGVDCFVGLARDVKDILDSLSGKCRLGLVDGRPTREICALSDRVGLECLIGTKNLRRPIKGWKHDNVAVRHCDVGGVTTSASQGVCLVQGNQKPTTIIRDPVVPRDASTMLSVQAPTHRYRDPPQAAVLSPLGCENLGTLRAPYFHGGGLLPDQIDRKTLVLTPGVYAPKGKWALRSLTVEEVIVAKDFGSLLPVLIAVERLTNQFLHTLVPGKILVALATQWGCNGGGGSVGSDGGSLGTSFLLERAKTPGLENPDEARIDVVKDLERRPDLANHDEAPLKRQKLEVELKLEELANEDGDSSAPNPSEAAANHRTSFPPVKPSSGFLNDAGEVSETCLDEISREHRQRKAVKSDNAKVPEYLWEAHLLEGCEGINQNGDVISQVRTVIDWLREQMLRWWKRKVTSSYVAWVKSKYRLTENNIGDWFTHKWTRFKTGQEGTLYGWAEEGEREYKRWWKERFLATSQDYIPGSDAVSRAAKTSWWGWDAGSRPFHWRWPTFYQGVIRDGLEVHFQSAPPKYRRAQRDIKDEDIKAKVIAKLKKVRERGYISPGMAESLTAFFEVEKGDDDIRLVYDGSVSGFNMSIWVPRFFLPTIRTHLRAVDEDTYMADVDIGEMFLNFVLHRQLQVLAGVDLTHYFPKGDTGSKVWEVWLRAAMGLRSSPYQAVQAMGVAEEVIRGDRKDPTNVYRWDTVRLNLLGSCRYKPYKPWVSKFRSSDQKLAADLFIFVDDLRPTGPSRKEGWEAAKKAASTLNHLGIQDAPRKRRDISQSPGAWAGSVIRTGAGGVSVLTSQEKWDKSKRLLQEVWDMLELDPTKLVRKCLEQIRGFLQYVIQTYSGFASYLIGFHMTVDGFRRGRDENGWRMAEALWKEGKEG
jgi:hypothetical protein